MQKIAINRQYSAEIDKIYSIIVKKRNVIFVYYKDNKGQKKIAKLYQNLSSFISLLNQLRIVEGLPQISIIIEEEVLNSSPTRV